MSEETSNVYDALRVRGFAFKGRAVTGRLVFEGPLRVGGRDVQCELGLDPDFFVIPYIKLISPAAVIKRKITPHLGHDGTLCYLAAGAMVVDVFDPVGQTLACLAQAERVLNGALEGKYLEDLEEEFQVYWGGELCLLDIQDVHAELQAVVMTPSESGVFGAITDDYQRTLRKLQAIKRGGKQAPWPAFCVSTGIKPRPNLDVWPPKTVGQFLNWQGGLDVNCRKALERKMLKALQNGAPGVVLMVHSPLVRYCVGVLFRDSAVSGKRILRNKSWLYERRLFRLEGVRIDDCYVAERNTPGVRTLAGKKIVLVGAGTIGGYLAEMLVKAGAGTSGGQLIVVDPDYLFPQNLGRHRLGFSHLFKHKADALSEELTGVSPGCKISGVVEDVRHVELRGVDLLVNATGEEALGHWLCRYAREQPTLTVWIEGPGSAVRGLLKASNRSACFRCLCDANREGALLATEEPVEPLMAGNGCEGLYVPFPASVSVQAASLAAEMVQAWCSEEPAPALRTRVIDQTRTLATPDCDPLANADCPACCT
ncbi:ThiF family adenylyltransferase [Aquabacterium sp.]|uniref:ThiF family adenylyltransferase n=1 Tax=Aquabacterium sp. TaxID=1872578 RepID=UPI0024890842|nr:ThiF family adenylyltransferase [Aquabacterium sp.]MDI1258267.1 ThiF family adenylyltransferase [Aquabacterium sp.]